jgi:hypothetical protein
MEYASNTPPAEEAHFVAPGEPAADPAWIPHAPILITLFTLDLLAGFAWSSLVDWNSLPAAVAMVALAGAGLGQFLLFALWAALGPEPGVWRLPALFLLTFLAVILAILPLGDLYDDFMPGGQPEGLLLLLPLMFCAAQTPAWAVRLFGRRRMAPAASQSNRLSSPGYQFRVLHLLGATAGAAVVLGAARVGMAWESEPDLEDWLQAAILFVFVASVSVFYSLPALWIGVGARDPWFAGLVVGLLFSFLAIAFSLALTMAASLYVGGAYLLMFSVYHGGVFGVLLGGLIPFRLHGFALRRIS